MAFRPPSPGVLLDNKYRLAERIGGGGMGDVFRAEPVAGGRSVAVKFLHHELAQNTELSQRFFQEAQAVSRIRHTNVVDVIDTGVGEMGPYFVMEYLDGESVGAALLRVTRFDVDAAVGTCIPVLEALDAAHRAGIIHRDLKPENVFIAFDASRGMATVRLLDFGIAKMTDGGSGPSPRTRTGVVFGTPDYLSPEQATGDSPLDGRSDLFAVGVLLFELLTGSRPFRGPTAVATAFRVVHAETPSLASSGANVDPKVESIVQRLLQKDPAKRFPTAIEVIRELERIVPDPARRLTALGRIINIARRMLPVAGASLREDASAREQRRSSNPDLSFDGQVSARTMQSMASSRGPESQQRPAPVALVVKAGLPPPVEPIRLPPRVIPGEFPKTIRSALDVAGAGVLSRSEDLTTTLVGVGASPLSQLTAVRSFPQRFAGRFHVRGPILRSVDKVVAELFGAEARDEIVAQMPSAYSSDFRNGSINALVAYELEALDAYMEYATSLVVRDIGRWREIGRVSVDGELYNVVRTLLRPSVDIAAVLRRGTSIWARLFSFGVWRVAARPDGRAELHIGEFEPSAQPLRYWVAGVVEQTVRRAVRSDARVVITAGEQSFSNELVCEIG
jgi:serine/threonine protein kinase